MQDDILNIILRLYIENDWTELTYATKKIYPYVHRQSLTDPMGRRIHQFKLNLKGIQVAEDHLRMYGRKTGPKKGIALERRYWEKIESPPFSGDEMIEALVEIATRGSSLVEVFTDGYEDRKRVVVRDIEGALSRVSLDIEWESFKTSGEKYLIGMCQFSEPAAWLWVHYLDPMRKHLRDTPFQQEFIVWDDS